MNAPSSTPDVHVYRIRYWRMLVAGAVFAQLLLGGILLVGGVVAAIDGSQLNWTDLLFVYVAWSVGTLILLCPAFLLLIFALPVKVSAANFFCPNGFGTMVSVPWGEITRVRSLPIPGFPYLMVSTSGRWLKLWLPLCLNRFPEFVEDVGRYAGHEHILYQALWLRAEQK